MRTGCLAIAALLTFGMGAACLPVIPSESAAPEGPTPAAPKVLSPGRSLRGLYEVGEIRGFEFRQNGNVIGRSWGRYEGEVEVQGRPLHRVSTRIELTSPQQASPLRTMTEVLFDQDGRLVSGFERGEAAEIRFEADDETLKLTALTGLPNDDRIELGFPSHGAAMAYMAIIHEEIMLARRPLIEGEQKLLFVSLSSARAEEWTGVVRRSIDHISIETSLGERIEFDEKGRILEIEVSDEELQIVSMTDAWPSWEIAAPIELVYRRPAEADWTVREVDLPGRGDEPRLAGEVLIPAGSGPRPAVLMLGGSARADRHGFAGPPAVDLGTHEIGDALVRSGFVVLRYDERATGASELAESSWLGQLEDARRGLRTLLVQDEVDPSRVVVVGHGEGAWRGLTLAAEYPREITGVAVLASPAATFRKVLSTQPKLIDALEKGTPLPDALEPHRRWYAEILDVDPLALLKKVRSPIWISRGDVDFEVAAPSIEAWTRAAKQSKVKASVTRYPGLDHLFKPEPGVSSAERYRSDRRVDGRFISDLVALVRIWTAKR